MAKLKKSVASFELTQAIETFRFLSGLLVQAWAILAGANALVLVYSLSQRIAIGLVLGGIIAGVATIAGELLYRTMFPVAVVALRAEQRLSKEPGLVAMVGIATASRTIPRLSSQLSNGEPAEQRKFSPFGRPGFGSLTTRVIAVVAVAQIAAGVTFGILGVYPWFGIPLSAP